jgi:hypothetical protein
MTTKVHRQPVATGLQSAIRDVVASPVPTQVTSAPGFGRVNLTRRKNEVHEGPRRRLVLRFARSAWSCRGKKHSFRQAGTNRGATRPSTESPATPGLPVCPGAICVHLCSSVFPQSRALSAAGNDRWRLDRDAARLLVLRHEGNHRCTQMHTDGSCSAVSAQARRPIGWNRSWPRNAGQVTNPGRWHYPPDLQASARGLTCRRLVSTASETAASTTHRSTGGRQPTQLPSVALRVPCSSSVLNFSIASAKTGARPVRTNSATASRAGQSPARLPTPPAPLTGLRASTLK